MTSYSPTSIRFLSFNGYCIEIDEPPSPAGEPPTTSATNTLFINIAARFTTRRITSSNSEESGAGAAIAQVPGRSALFQKLFSLPLHALSGGNGSVVRDTVASMLSTVHVHTATATTLESGWSVVDEILKYSRRMADHGWRSSFLLMDVRIAAFVEELPETSEDENCLIVIENINNIDDSNNNDEWDNGNLDPHNHDDDDEEIVMISNQDFNDGDDHDYDNEEAEEDRNISLDDYIIRFEPASKESIQGLEKVKINDDVSESNKQDITCSVCFEDVLVGSEATRLPCSHLFHGDCIVKWLQNSKYCPLCRFELPS